jgi:light-regulated signal transduction histidine kinase (bacteriophytochrome)
MIGNYVQLLAGRYQGKLDRDADEFIGYAVEGSRRLQRMITDLLAYARIGGRPQELRRVETEPIVGEVLENLRLAIAESGAAVERGALPAVFADAVQLRTLLQNLIGNALKFKGAQPPRVRISARDNGEEHLFLVEDNGIGIEPQYFERIFKMFQRLHTRQSYPGNGVGLALCKKIVEGNGGRIWVESEPGKGARFYFTIPKGSATKGPSSA